MIEGNFFVTPHAVNRYRDRARAGWRMTFEQAREHLIKQMQLAHPVKKTKWGAILFRGPKPERLRLIVGPGTGDRCSLVTVLTKSDRD
jgi:hypothetical protein